MKKLKQLFCAILVAALLFTQATPVSAASADAGNLEQGAVTAKGAGSVKLSKKKVTLICGKSTTIKLTGGKIKSAKSSNKKIATVTKSGKITAKKVGTATITITSTKNKKYTCKVTVKAGLDRENVTLTKGASTTVKLNGAKPKSVKSSNSSVVSVTKKGKITAKKKGSAKITYKDTKNKKYTCKVKVETPALSSTGLSLKVGDTYHLSLSGNTQKVTWSSDNMTVAEVDNYGKVTAKAVGNAKINAKVASGQVYKCTVAVQNASATVYTVYFKSNGGSYVSNQYVREGEKAVKPENPERNGYIFAGWYTDYSCEHEFSFDTPVTQNITLYAKWNRIDNLADDIIDLGDIVNMASEGTVEVIYGNDGGVRMVDGTFTAEKVDSAADAADVLNSASTLFGENFYARSLAIKEQTAEDTAETQETFYRFSPTVDGIPVLGSQVILTADDEGNVSGLFNTYNDKIYDVDTWAEIEEDEAEEKVLALLVEEAEISNYLDTLVSDTATKEEVTELFKKEMNVTPELVIYAGADNEKPILVYTIRITGYEASADTENEEADDSEVTGTEMPLVDVTYYIYANGEQTGEVYAKIQNVDGWETVQLSAEDLLGNTRMFTGEEEDETYRLKDTIRNIETYKTKHTGLFWLRSELPGNLVKTMGFFGTERADKTAISVHANMSDVYDYYKDVLGRKSFDGQGAKIITSYDYGIDYENAFWTSAGQQFVFGNKGDLAAALDVLGHEFTHAVVNYVVGNGTTTTLNYYGESGALNEAYADILGSLVEGKTDSNCWLMGEDSALGAIRSMEQPSLYDQPENYSVRYIGTEDNGGVHRNSGIFNFAAYKMMTDSRTSSISRKTWAKVFYHSLYRLGINATFLDARGAVISSAKVLGFTQEQQQAIKDAFDAVGITEPEAIRIILTWGNEPSDLDSHLVGPGVNAEERFHIFFNQKNYYADGSYYSDNSLSAADLDYDDTTSYGPEVTTIHKMTEGEYYFYVHDYSNGCLAASTEMANSQATVRIYKGSNSTPIRVFKVDPSSIGTYWNVFKLTIDHAGEITIDEIGTYAAAETLS